MKKILINIVFLFSCQFSQAQGSYFATGLLHDDGTYEKLPRKADLLSREYTVLPSKFSLSQFCPKAKSQSEYGTCVSWATAYAARTIAEAVKNGWTDNDKITNEAFSPLFVYALIKDKVKFSDDDNCQKGTYLYKALQLMKEKGVPKFSKFDVLCANYINDSLMLAALPFKIDDYFTLFSFSSTDVNEKIRKVKKSLSEECPVVIAMNLPESFFDAGAIWSGIDVNPSNHGYHAMCVVGYDDNMNGGAFEIMNSWGTNWGNNGFVWVKYDDFAKYVDQAYELFVKKVKKTEPKPMPRPILLNNFDGEIKLQLSIGEEMVPVLNPSGFFPRYMIADEFISRTRYRVYISNNEPAYVYIISSDLTNNVTKLFPPTDNISPALTYKSNHVAIPDETYYLEMDDTKGTDYLCVLYSKDALDINGIVNKIKSSEGSFYDKAVKAISNIMVSPNDIRYVVNVIGFSARSEKTVVPIFVEISHK